MKLLRYEMKKLLFNKGKLILLAALFGVYTAIGFFFGYSVASGEVKGAEVWNTFFIAFDGIIVFMFFLMVLTFFISPLFTQEVKTEMDSIILCSVKGKREIVTAKLLGAGITSAIIAVVYLLGFFAGALISCGSLDDINAPVRTLASFASSALNMTIGGTALLSVGWLLVVSVVFGLTLALVSALIKNQSAAFGAGLVLLVAGVMSNSLGGNLRQIAWPFMDFNFCTMAQFNAIFGGNKMYNLFGYPVPYGTVAFVVCLVLGTVVCLLTYAAQKKRAVV